MPEKKCANCNQVKPLDEFYRNKTRKGGYDQYCILCRKIFYKKNRTKFIEKYRKKGRLDHYPIDEKAYDKMLRAQSGQCAICGIMLNIEGQYTSHIDHDHDTGAIRGILCRDCNLALGHIENKLSNGWEEKALKYLKINKNNS